MASKQAIASLSKLFESLTGESINGYALDVWQRVLDPISDDLLESATLAFLRKEQRRYAIMPGAIYQSALELLREASPAPGEAWAMLNAALEEVDAGEGWGEFQALPVVIQTAAKQVGIPGLLGGNHMMADRARFLQFYEATVDRQAKAQLALPTASQAAIAEGR